MSDKNVFGVMLDMSRNGVMKVDQVKKYVDYLSAFGYNMLQLYTEDTYEIDGEPYFGYLRGAYTKQELKEIDAYCISKGVELVPCIQTLAHLNQIFRWDYYHEINDTADILLVGHEKTYKLIENMFKTVSECFTSRKINIGMDEAHFIGKGKYLEINGYKTGFEIIKGHLEKVVEIAQKYGFKPMMWSDMFFRMANGGEYYAVSEKGISEEAKKSVPKDISLVYWDYYKENKRDYEKMLKAHLQFDNEIWFAGGAWSWVGFASCNGFSLKSMKPAFKACRETGVKNIFLTVWGDDGRECSQFAILPTLFYLKKYYDGVTDIKAIKDEFYSITGERFDDMMALDLPNNIAGNKNSYCNPCKHMLYNDPFLGVLDSVCQDGVEDEYKKYARKFAIMANKNTPFAYLYASHAKLCKALSLKYGIGVKTRKAYETKDKEQLKMLIPLYKDCEKAVKDFYKAFSNLWYTECKPMGFEVQDVRLGGLMRRISSCRERLEKYIAGEIDALPELDMPILDFWNKTQPEKQIPVYQNWKHIISTSVV